MLAAKKVSKAIIVGNKTLLDSVVDVLYQLNCIHIEDFDKEDSFLSIGRPGKAATEASNKLVKLRSFSNFLGLKPHNPDTLVNQDSLLHEMDDKLDELDSAISRLTDKRNYLDNELKAIESKVVELEPFSQFPLDVDMYKGYNSISVHTGFVHSNEIETDIRSITTDYELFISSYNKMQVIALFISKEYEERIVEVLDKNAFSEIHIPELTGNPQQLISGMINRKQDIQIELASIESEIDILQKKYKDFVQASDEVLSITTQKAEAPLKFATSDNTFIIDCWISDDEFEKVVSTIEHEFNGRIFISKLDLEEEEIESESIPIEYDNPNPVKPLETIMDLYSRPTYKEIDPSAIIFITFPLFYGIMLGDIGYGLVLITLGMVGIAKIKEGELRSLSTLLVYCSISTIIFGILYAEIFGFHIFGHHSIVTSLMGENSVLGMAFYNFSLLPILDRLNPDDIPILLIASALIGVVHLNLGFLLGFRNMAISHGMKEAVLEKISWIVLQLGIAIVIIAYLGFIPQAGLTIGAAVAVLGFVMLIAGEGMGAILELPSILSNTLSYTRLAAVGLSSVGIAFAVNEIVTTMLFPEGGIFIIIGILVLIIGHTVNTVLGVVAPGLHALRLQYVEFFTKFYEGGGRKFNPFGYIRKYTEVK
jgi:V/A-type H+-transporting ATPase subunit I